ncbi:MAG: PAS domain S-box protein [Anaerolineaceae bacterium]|nr:PAS domain S-box protein [Anaerolineaceae bacterium]
MAQNNDFGTGKKDHLPARHPLLAAILILCASLLIGFFISRWYRQDMLNEQRDLITTQIHPYSKQLTTTINKDFSILESLSAFAQTQTLEEAREKFPAYASGLIDGKDNIRALQFFSDEYPELVYPIEGNEAVVGRSLDDLINDDRPAVRADVARAIESGKITLSAPYELRQGGLGMVGRLAIYQQNTLYGLVVVIIDIPETFQAASLTPAPDAFRFAIRDQHGQILIGDETVFDSQPVIDPVPLPEGSWALAAIPNGGWEAAIRRSMTLFWMVALFISILLSIIFYNILVQRKNLETAVIKRTSELSESQKSYQQLFDLNADAVFVLDPAGNILDANQAACAGYGYTRDELLLLKASDLTAPDLRDSITPLMKKALSEGAQFNCRQTHKDGREIPVEVNARPIVHEGKPAILSSLRDISRRQKNEDALRKLNQRLEILRQIDQEILFAATLEEITHSILTNIPRLLPCSAAVIDLYDPLDSVVRARFALSDSADTVQLSHNLPLPPEAQLTALRQGQFAPALAVEHNPSGSQTQPDQRANSVLVPVMDKTRLLGTINLFDLLPEFFTKENQAAAAQTANLLAIAITHYQMNQKIQSYAQELEERVVQRTAELAEANREMEAVTYSISHDLKTPLRAIDGYSHLLAQEYGRSLNAEGLRFIESIQRAARTMEQLITDLLTYSRIELHLAHAVNLDPNQLAESIITGYSEQIEAHQIEVNVSIPFNTLFVNIDGLNIVLDNLIKNALKFSRDVPHPRIEVSGKETESEKIIWIKDNGIGFSMQYHDRIFEMFQRLNRAEEFQGTGIGLALVKKATERMGGRVWAESEPGKGATFYIAFSQRKPQT